MTIEEFIQKVNALSEDELHGLVAFMKDNGAPAIADAYQCHTLAYLPGYTKRWVFYGILIVLWTAWIIEAINIWR